MVSVSDNYVSSQILYTNEFMKMKPSRNNFNSNGDSFEYYVSTNIALFEAIKVQRYRQAVLLLQGGISPNSRNENSETPLIFVAKYLSKKDQKRSREKLAKVLLEFGADPNLQDDTGKTALMYAAAKGLTELILLLLNRSDVTLQDREGNTAVMHAVKFGSSAIIRTFVEYFVAFGVDPNFLRQRNIYGKTALEMAKESGKSDCVHALTNFVTHNFELPYEWRMINTTESKSTQDSESSPVKPDTRALSRRKPAPEKRKENNRNSEEQEMKLKVEQPKAKNVISKSEVFQEIWEQETMNWFNGDSHKSANGNKSAKSTDSVDKPEEFKLPPINSGKLIDYKTWCEMGENTGRQNRSNSFVAQSSS